MSLHADQASKDYYRIQSRTVVGDKAAYGFGEGWTAPVAIFDAEQGFGEEAWLDAMPLAVLSTRLQGAPVTWYGNTRVGRVSGPGSSVLAAKGMSNASRASGAVRFSHIYLPDKLIDRVADAIRPGAVASSRLRDDLVFVPDRVLDERIASYLRAATSGASVLELEASAILLVGHLLRAHHGFGDPQALRGGLAPWQLKRACEAMEAHLDSDIGLDMLSATAHCSPTHFSRAFKRSTGVPPFRWLLERRVSRAKTLLADSRTPLAEIALATGFAAQPQFTTAFRRVTGLTPGMWRREHSK